MHGAHVHKWRTLPEISQKCLNENFGASLRLYFIQNPIYGNGNTSTDWKLVCPADASYKQLGPRSNSAKCRA